MTESPRLTSAARVLSVVPHHGHHAASEDWLAECLDALLAQRRPADAIIVVDDESPVPPHRLPLRYPNVAFFRTSRNVGPFAIFDVAVQRAPFDALLMQDSDDLSEPHRLEMLLDAACDQEAELVGCQIRAFSAADWIDAAAVCHNVPVDPRGALMERPTSHVMHLNSSLLSLDLARRIGGFSSGLRFGADSEFQRRAVFAGVARNVERIGYARRLHPDSLTRHPATGFGSPARVALAGRVQQRAHAIVAAVRAGMPPDFAPLEKGEPIALEHWAGPRPTWL